jgi:AmiR/NasT family two-component response regulator
VDQIERWTPQGEADTITRAAAEIVEHRAVIEQAEGVLMAVYSIDAQAAFDLLKWGSQHTRTKLQVVAEQLITGFRSLQSDHDAPRLTIDQLLLQARERG